jgi:hypothetical protein
MQGTIIHQLLACRCAELWIVEPRSSHFCSPSSTTTTPQNALSFSALTVAQRGRLEGYHALVRLYAFGYHPMGWIAGIARLMFGTTPRRFNARYIVTSDSTFIPEVPST